MVKNVNDMTDAEYHNEVVLPYEFMCLDKRIVIDAKKKYLKKIEDCDKLLSSLDEEMRRHREKYKQKDS